RQIGRDTLPRVRFGDDGVPGVDSAKAEEKREQMCSRFFFDWIEYLASENLQFERIRFRAETVWLIGRDGDCGPRSGEPIPSLVISSLGHDKDLTGQSPLPSLCSSGYNQA
ncbi:MAG: hypothetical protein WB696_29065, partial [Chthoniobacterales bacterium]